MSSCFQNSIFAAVAIALPLFMFLSNLNMVCVYVSAFISFLAILGLLKEKDKKAPMYNTIGICFLVGQAYCLLLPMLLFDEVPKPEGVQIIDNDMVAESMKQRGYQIPESTSNSFTSADTIATVGPAGDITKAGPLTFSVVLPCAEEGILMVKTARSIVEGSSKHKKYMGISCAPIVPQHGPDVQKEEAARGKCSLKTMRDAMWCRLSFKKNEKEQGAFRSGEVGFLEWGVFPKKNVFRSRKLACEFVFPTFFAFAFVAFILICFVLEQPPKICCMKS